MSKIELLAAALKKANEAALAAKGDPNDDGGSSNFDSCTIELRGWSERDILEATDQSGITISDKLGGWMWKYSRFVNVELHGQGYMRTRMAEAAKQSLANDGYTVGMYYQMD